MRSYKGHRKRHKKTANKMHNHIGMVGRGGEAGGHATREGSKPGSEGDAEADGVSEAEKEDQVDLMGW